ncbi:hypothetical protein QFZ65_001880 [Arthrobacter sp. B3I9]|nr:hypothetical protein [Arthrobacter sp. B3I9]
MGPCMDAKRRRSVGRATPWTEEGLSLSVARTEAIRVAVHILELDQQLAANEKQPDELVRSARLHPCWRR